MNPQSPDTEQHAQDADAGPEQKPGPELSVNLFGWIFLDEVPLSPERQYAFCQLVKNAPAEIWDLKPEGRQGCWTHHGAGGTYIIRGRACPENPDLTDVRVTLDRDGETATIHFWTQEDDMASDGDEALMYAVILKHEAAARNLTLAEILDNAVPAASVPDSFIQAWPGESRLTDEEGDQPF